MIGLVFRGARLAARSGGQPGPRKEFSPGGKAVAWFFIIAGLSAWWKPILCGVAALAVIGGIMIACVMAGKPSRDQEADDLDKIVGSWQDKP